ncbi:S-layer homology domain-containing protein [Lysinibacillus sp. 54212]|uniref:S-layer homology domain-containing protein n=1 Tax=Lysinibacillus sp. 54212 TaxID=3119829 RepID=UPI002FCA43BB
MRKSQGLLIILLAFLLVVVSIPQKSSAKFVDLTGGIKNEYTYEEYIFLTGQPIRFTGTSKDVKVTTTKSGNKITEKYSIKLVGPNSSTLTRDFTYVSNVSDYDTIGQSTATGDVTRFKEIIKIGSVTYTLADYQLSKSVITDKRAASDYFSGNAIFRKTYTYKLRNGLQQEITVNGYGKNVGYENYWGATETQIMEYVYSFADGREGLVKNRVSHSKSKTLNYEENPASQSSFDGGYSVNTDADTMSEYTYELPSGTGTIEFNSEYMPRIERLIVPKFRDLSKHWAKPSIEKLYSLGIFTDNSNFFSPNTPMLRYDFAIAVAKATDRRVELEKQTQKPVAKPNLFNDVRTSRVDYNYLVSAVNKGVIAGMGPKTFQPEGRLTRQQAATILVRALGFEGKAPDPGYKTHYTDDAKIANYARDAVYVVTELGLMHGDGTKFNPTGTLTRAESASLIVRFLLYLENDLKQNYRDDILFFE